jgi:hypothetical protein
MERHHPEMMQAGDEEAVLGVGRRPLRQIPATDCPCCSHEWIDRLKERTFSDKTNNSILTVSPQVFKRHLASHLEQLALFAIPIGSSSHEEMNSNVAIEEKTCSRTDETKMSALTFHSSKLSSGTTEQVNHSVLEGSIDRNGEWDDGAVTTSLSAAVQIKQRLLTGEEKRKIPLRLSKDFAAYLMDEPFLYLLNYVFRENKQEESRATLQICDEIWKLIVKKEDDSRWRCMIPECGSLFEGQNFWREHVKKCHPEWFEDLNNSSYSISEGYMLGHVECPETFYSEVCGRYTQLLKHISDHANNYAKPQTSPCSPTGDVPTFQPFVARATRSFYSQFVVGDLEFSPGKLVIVTARADQYIKAPDTRKLSHWYYGKWFAKPESLESATGIFPRNFVEWQADMTLDSNSKVATQPQEVTFQLQDQPLKAQQTEISRAILAEEIFDPLN